MKIGTFGVAASALALALAVGIAPSYAQGPLYDRVDVKLPYTVTIGDKTLQPGDYVIRETPGAAKSYVLLIYSDDGMKFETSTMTIPTLDTNTPEDTKVVLHHFGNDYYFDKIWIQGKNYGYEFPLPNSVKEREKERMQPVSLAATYQAAPPSTTTAQNTMPPAAALETTPPPPVAETTPPPVPPLETAAAAPMPAPEAAPQQMSAPTMESGANREMPATSSGWLMMLLAGSSLSGAGMMLRRR
jgi:hypothetical protein